jgi:hypothetical protein
VSDEQQPQPPLPANPVESINLPLVVEQLLARVERLEADRGPRWNPRREKK